MFSLQLRILHAQLLGEGADPVHCFLPLLRLDQARVLGIFGILRSFPHCFQADFCVHTQREHSCFVLNVILSVIAKQSVAKLNSSVRICSKKA